MSETDRDASVRDLLAINAIPGLGVTLYERLIDRFGSWAQIRRANKASLYSVPGIGTAIAEAIRTADRFDPAIEIEQARQLGVELIPCTSPDYPANLKVMHGAPLLLYARGRLLPSDQLALAIVGARHCTHYGQAQAERLAYGLAKLGFCIVSGMARGIDAAAHRGALRAKGRTIAVQGCGLVHVYPREHEALAAEIAANGAVLSELPLDTAPRPFNFPPRNRIIAGLSLGVIVVEARERSGALITARWITELNRQVYAVPGMVDNPLARGPHALLRDGAKLVAGVEDVIEELGPLGVKVPTTEDERVDDPRSLTLEGNEKALFMALSSQPLTIDDLAAQTALPIPHVSSTLMVLEIKGLIRQLPGKRFVRP